MQRIQKEGVTRKQVGLVIETEPLSGPNTQFWPVMRSKKIVGKVTSAVFSPRLEKNIAMAMVDSDSYELGARVEVAMNDRVSYAKMVTIPFYDPSKTIAKV